MNLLDQLGRMNERFVQRAVGQVVKKHLFLAFGQIPFDVNVRYDPGDHVFAAFGVAMVILVKLGGETPFEAQVNFHIINPDPLGLRYSQQREEASPAVAGRKKLERGSTEIIPAADLRFVQYVGMLPGGREHLHLHAPTRRSDNDLRPASFFRHVSDLSLVWVVRIEEK